VTTRFYDELCQHSDELLWLLIVLCPFTAVRHQLRSWLQLLAAALWVAPPLFANLSFEWMAVFVHKSDRSFIPLLI
jgi:hypothetical protein